MKTTRHLMNYVLVLGFAWAGCNSAEEGNDPQSTKGKGDNNSNCPSLELPNPDKFDCESYLDDQGCTKFKCVEKTQKCPLIELPDPDKFDCEPSIDTKGCPSLKCVPKNQKCPLIELPDPDKFDCESYLDEQGCPKFKCVEKTQKCPLIELPDPKKFKCESYLDNKGCAKFKCVEIKQDCPLYSLPNPDKFICEGIINKNNCPAFKCCAKDDKDCIMDKCNALAAAYDDARDNALACSVTSPDCTQRITNDLKCGLSSYANAKANVESFKTDWTKWQCGMIDWKCPMYSSLPPGTQVFGVCNIAQGQCETQYVFPK